MSKYRKKPVVIEAEQFTGDGIPAMCAQDGHVQFFESSDGLHTWLQIETLEGSMTAAVGDFIIRGVQGEMYPCKPDIFAATYEEVTT